jgi:hypothetical protein
MSAGLCTGPAERRRAVRGPHKGTLGRVETVTGGIERPFGLLHRGQGLGERVLGRGQPAPQVSQLPDRLAVSPRPVCHPTILASSTAGLSIGRGPPRTSYATQLIAARQRVMLPEFYE